MKTQLFFYSVVASILLTGLGNSFSPQIHANQDEQLSYSGSINGFCSLALTMLGSVRGWCPFSLTHLEKSYISYVCQHIRV